MYYGIMPNTTKQNIRWAFYYKNVIVWNSPSVDLPYLQLYSVYVACFQIKKKRFYRKMFQFHDLKRKSDETSLSKTIFGFVLRKNACFQFFKVCKIFPPNSYIRHTCEDYSIIYVCNIVKTFTFGNVV